MRIEEPTLTKAILEYTDFEVAGRRVQIPYYLHPKKRKWRFWEYSSKEPASRIRNNLLKKAAKRGFGLSQRSSDEITSFMKDNRLGIDCSGFVYQVLKPLVKEKANRHLGVGLKRLPGVLGELEMLLLLWRRERRIGAKLLNDDLNSVPVENLAEVRPGDLIKLTPISDAHYHIAVVVWLERNAGGDLREIVAAHSGRYTVPSGPHLVTIEVTAPALGIEDQVWHETLKEGLPVTPEAYKGDFRTTYLRAGYGERLRRLRVLL